MTRWFNLFDQDGEGVGHLMTSSEEPLTVILGERVLTLREIEPTHTVLSTEEWNELMERDIERLKGMKRH